MDINFSSSTEPLGNRVLSHATSRYRDSRTLVRRLCRSPHEGSAEFKQKISRIHVHFEQFNVDTSELCQWLMGLRKRYSESCKKRGDTVNPASFGPLADFLLEPSLDDEATDEAQRDRWRLHVFDDVAGFRNCRSLENAPLPQQLRDAMEEAAAVRPLHDSKNSNGYKLFERLRTLEPQHRLVLLKSAAEWIVARYQRGVENWVRQHDEWQKEKLEWETQHPNLTEAVRDQFTNVYRQLKDPEREDMPGLRKKNPRICLYERMRGNRDNCIYAGQKGHGPHCWKYQEFVRDQRKRNKKFNPEHFASNAKKYIGFRSSKNSQRAALDRLFEEEPRCRSWFKDAWDAYLRDMELNEQTVVGRGCLPHCAKIGDTYDKSKCEWNPHTHYCLEYNRALDNPNNAFDADTINLEKDYREWRRFYLAGPRKPAFKYPSSRDMPMPKIFGDGFYEVDFDRSKLRLRLDDMSAGEWVEFSFIPWPRKYKPSRKQVKNMVTSVHLNFVGTRARAGFRFEVPHAESRFACTQDELDELRSRAFPRQAQDQKFLDAAREKLTKSFNGDPESELRILAVDMGMGGAHATVYEGKVHQVDLPIPIVKVNKSYVELPTKLDKNPKDEKMRGPLQMATDPEDQGRIIDTRGLRKEHVGRHLKAIGEGATVIAEKRRKDTDDPLQTLRDSDFRGLKRHIRWMIRDWVRVNAKQMIDLAAHHRCHVIVFESLRGSRRPDYDKLGTDSDRQKAERILYAYGQVRRKVTEKAVERGMRVVTAPYHKSSKVCHKCGKLQEAESEWRKNKKKRKFKCEHEQCSNKNSNSDANAARVLARVFWGDITLPPPK
jgi:hypothetical protein